MAPSPDHISAEHHSRTISVPRGSSLFFPGDSCSGFVVVHAGTIVVTLTAENGREIVLYRVGPGDICLQTFGCLVNGGTYSAQGSAETDLTIEMIPAGDFEARMAGDPLFRRDLLVAVASRFGDLERLVADVALSSIALRLARALLRLADGQRADGQGADGRLADGRLVDGLGADGQWGVNTTHEALASEIGSAREVVSRHLALMARDGLIETTRGHIALLDVQALRALAQEAAPA